MRNPVRQRRNEAYTDLCTFSIAATSARAARLKNADTAGMSGAIL